MSKNPKNWWKSLKIANIDREILDIFLKTWGISMKFSGKAWLMIILKVTKKQGFTLSLEDVFFEKPQGRRGRGQIEPTSRFMVNGFQGLLPGSFTRLWKSRSKYCVPSFIILTFYSTSTFYIIDDIPPLSFQFFVFKLETGNRKFKW